MSIATRNAEVTWDGSLAGGSGVLSSGSHALQDLPVTWAARTEAPAGKTSPEELDRGRTRDLLHDGARAGSRGSRHATGTPGDGRGLHPGRG